MEMLSLRFSSAAKQGHILASGPLYFDGILLVLDVYNTTIVARILFNKNGSNCKKDQTEPDVRVQIAAPSRNFDFHPPPP